MSFRLSCGLDKLGYLPRDRLRLPHIPSTHISLAQTSSQMHPGWKKTRKKKLGPWLSSIAFNSTTMKEGEIGFWPLCHRTLPQGSCGGPKRIESRDLTRTGWIHVLCLHINKCLFIQQNLLSSSHTWWGGCGGDLVTAKVGDQHHLVRNARLRSHPSRAESESVLCQHLQVIHGEAQSSYTFIWPLT